MILVPCKNCGASDNYKIKETIRKSGDHQFKVYCSSCGLTAGGRNTIRGAELAWNEKNKKDSFV